MDAQPTQVAVPLLIRIIGKLVRSAIHLHAQARSGAVEIQHIWPCRVLAAEVPWVEWPLSPSEVPATPVILDLLEFCAGAVGQPVQESFHEFFRHHHLSWDRAAGLERFVADVNMLFRRNALAFELTPEGQARRLLPAQLTEAIGWTLFQTGDGETDRLLEAARRRFVSPKMEDRQDSLEKLWDAFERLKTLEPGRTNASRQMRY